MAGISNWFSFTSKEEREERSAEYFKRMFPLGAQQKTKEEELLQQLISAKTSDGDKLYQMLIVREALLQKDEKKRLAQLKKWYSARLLSVYAHRSAYSQREYGGYQRVLSDFGTIFCRCSR